MRNPMDVAIEHALMLDTIAIILQEKTDDRLIVSRLRDLMSKHGFEVGSEFEATRQAFAARDGGTL